MITINSNTKIATILKAHPGALNAIVSISPKFNKLRNPLLRKIMASRTSVSMASKIGGCQTEDFFAKLESLGFHIDRTIAEEKKQTGNNTPDFIKQMMPENTLELDVRPVIDSGKDPFKIITEKIKELKTGEVLKLINSFEPAPLIALLGNQGYETFVETVNENLINTYFYKSDAASVPALPINKDASDWDDILKQFNGRMHKIDVRQMEMPKPMLDILKELESLSHGNALFVYHKRIPVFLLPELAEQNFDYRIKEITDGEVNMIIFHK